MNNYKELKQLALSAKYNKSKPVAIATRVELRNGDIVAVKYHNTDIVTYYPNGDIKLNTDGWTTKTTKERINTYSPFTINQKNYVWYINGHIYKDNMLIKNGKIPTPLDNDGYTKKLNELKKRVKIYCDNFIKQLEANKVDYPNGGDCWYCLFNKNNKCLGDLTNNHEHLDQHLKDKYYFGSILANALIDNGFRLEQLPLCGFGDNKMYINPQKALYKYIMNRLIKTIEVKNV